VRATYRLSYQDHQRREKAGRIIAQLKMKEAAN
jgi:hypothetical protein